MKYSQLAIAAASNEETLAQLQQIHESMPDNSPSDIRKYSHFLLQYAQGKPAEELKHTIEEPLWDLFQKARAEMAD